MQAAINIPPYVKHKTAMKTIETLIQWSLLRYKDHVMSIDIVSGL